MSMEQKYSKYKEKYLQLKENEKNIKIKDFDFSDTSEEIEINIKPNIISEKTNHLSDEKQCALNKKSSNCELNYK